MHEILLTRQDDGLGDGLFDSVAWALSEHVRIPDTGEYQSAVMYGWNDDSPVRIEFYRLSIPNINDVPVFTWHAQK